MAVCEYCGGVACWNEQGLAGTGKRSMLSEGFTRLYRGATGTLRGQRFRVEGRVRYSFGEGFWDEWYVTTPDGTPAWLTEDDHELALQTRYDGSGVETRGVRPGQTLALTRVAPLRDGIPTPANSAGVGLPSLRFAPLIGAGSYVVLEIGQARCIGVEGRLPHAILPEEAHDYLDATSPDGRQSLGVERDDEGTTVLYLGEWLGHHELTLDDERR